LEGIEMKLQRVAYVACLICLILAPTLNAQDEPVAINTQQVVRLYSNDLPAEVDIQAYLKTGQVKLTNGLECSAPRIVTGPAPAPYPQAVIWEKGIEQLGPTSTACDGMWFINGNLWQPHKIALVMWKIRVPQPSKRLATEFDRDLTISLWVDGNEDKVWGKNERVLNESFNIGRFFPNHWSYLEIWYLTCFRIPSTSSLGQDSNGKGATKYETKLWVRGAVSYDDADVSPAGDLLFGEVEDYQIEYFEIRTKDKAKG
jgi:hypothetical protein